jgi:uncharacterized membrane protein
MEKIKFLISEKRTVLVFGSVLFGIELAILILLLVLDSTLAVKILSMISANHLGGRLAFIGLGLELGLPSSLIIFVIILYNTTYLLILNSLIVYFQEKIQKVKFIRHYTETLKKKAEMRARFMKKWSWMGITVFVWLPFPMTGAVMGSIIAYIEGYNIRNTLLMVIPSMWLGVVCWTLWFDELYVFIDQFGKGRTLILTLSLILLPLFYYLFNTLKKAMKNRF